MRSWTILGDVNVKMVAICRRCEHHYPAPTYRTDCEQRVGTRALRHVSDLHGEARGHWCDRGWSGFASRHPDHWGQTELQFVIEAEYDPANSVEDDAIERLGLTVEDGHRRIEAVIALRYPEALKYAVDIDGDVRSARFSYAVLYEGGERFPTSGWLQGSCEDIADMARLLSVPQSAVNEASDHLELGIETAADRLNEISELRPKVAWDIANLLGLSNVHQTRRMACAILANAMVFHDRVADMHDGIEHLHMVCGPDIANPQAEVLDCW